MGDFVGSCHLKLDSEHEKFNTKSHGQFIFGPKTKNRRLVKADKMSTKYRMVYLAVGSRAKRD